MRIVQVVASVAEEASGPSYSVSRLCRFLARAGAEVELHTVGPRQSRTRDGYLHDTWDQDWSRIPVLSRLYASTGLRTALTASAPGADIFHGHGLWLLPNIYPEWIARRSNKPLVISPRGMLGGAALRFSSMRKQIFWTVLQGSAVRGADCLHATSLQEYDDIRAFGLQNPVAIIPNGIDIPDDEIERKDDGCLRTVLYLGRLHPKKGIDQLIVAWSKVEEKHPGWQLEIVGPLDGTYPEKLRRLIADTGARKVRIAGPRYGAEKLRTYQRSDLFVLPTQNENFGNTIAEALAAGIPVITTKGAPWKDLVAHDCGWWIDHGSTSLAAALDQAMGLNSERLAEMGRAGRQWMEMDFSWDGVASSMLSVYRWLSGKGDMPPCVRCS